ncbi:MAG: lysophospholipid acyltransferase family protein [Gammaproteobacteria bacterium]|nr:lysophospholipid acyltransferase family protein [Gammaproteobacteria bacterium]
MRERLLKLLLNAFARLPFAWTGRLGALAGRVLYRVGRREVDNARVNLALCFPDMSDAQREALVRHNLIETGRSLAQMAKLWGGNERDWLAQIDDNGFIAAGRVLVERGNGVIFALPHIGNWELIAYPLIEIVATTALYRPPRMAALDDLMRAGRAASGVTPVPTDRQGLKALHAALQRGEGIVILPDQVPKQAGASGVVAPFFGHPAMTMTLISRLARRHGAPVLFACAVPDPVTGRHRMMHFEGDPAIADSVPEVAAAALNRDVERCVRAFPAHYQWTYRRFEIPGDKATSPYRRR